MDSVENYHSFFSDIRRAVLQLGTEVLWGSRTVPVNALAAAYPLGVFPWPGNAEDWIPWVCPLERGVLPLDKFRLGKSTRRHLNRAGFRVTLDQAFSDVIQACSAVPGRDTWIHPVMIEGYTEAYRLGFAHSVEVWLDNELVGGLYGIDSGHFFSGESMFHRRDHAGKAAIAFLVDLLRARGDRLLDIQQLTPHMAALGAEEWDRTDFLNAIRERLRLKTGDQLDFDESALFLKACKVIPEEAWDAFGKEWRDPWPDQTTEGALDELRGPVELPGPSCDQSGRT